MLLSSMNLNAQNDGNRGLFGMGSSSAYESNSRENLMRGDGPNIEGDITNNNFGSPLGSGIAILISAGFGYMVLKKKEDKQ